MAVNGVDYGVTPEGFVPRPFEDVVADIEAEVRDFAGASIPLGERTIEGLYIRIVGERAAELWEVGQQVDAGADPDQATGADEDAICAISGTIREGARPSTVVLSLTGDPGTPVPAASRARTASTEKEFETLADATLASVSAWAITTAYALADRVTNASRVYVCITAGTSAGAGGPTTTADDITDGTVHWRYIGEGTAAVDVDAESVDDGEIVATSGDITEITTPVGGWTSVKNLADATVGAEEEQDGPLRLRREVEIARAGSSPADAIRAEILDVAGVTAVTVFFNNTDVTDADGVPPHSVEVLVRGGVDQDIAEALFDAVAAGIGYYGNTPATVEDDEGIEHDVAFSRPDEVEIYVELEIEVDADLFPLDGADQIKAAIVTYGDGLSTGVDARGSRVGAAALTITGTLGFPAMPFVDDIASPVTTSVAISRRQLAVFDTSRIDLTVTPVTP